MRKFAILAVLAVLALAVSTSVSAGPGPVGAKYAWTPEAGPVGMLYVANAQGQVFRAFDAHGHLVMVARAESNQFGIPCPNDGPDGNGYILHLVLDGGSVFSFNAELPEDPEDWIWD